MNGRFDNPPRAQALALPGSSALADQRPLWLDQREAEVLVSLCLTSLGDAGEAEHPLFTKLGRYLRAFGG